MHDEGTQWKEIDFWKHHLRTTVYGGTAIFISLLLGGIFVYMLTSDVFSLYLSFGIGVFGVTCLVVPIVYYSKTAPQAVRYNNEKIYYLMRNGDIKKIHFSEIEKIECSYSERGGLEIRKDDGTKVLLGPGVGGAFGKLLLKEYGKWINNYTSKHAEIIEKLAGWAKIRMYEVSVSIVHINNRSGN